LREFLTFSTSGEAPMDFRRPAAAAVREIAAPEKTLESMTRGTSGTLEIWWPRARRRAGTEEAARAETVAKRLEMGC
jgi:hypothetical protein